jgi:type VI secretion system protein
MKKVGFPLLTRVRRPELSSPRHRVDVEQVREAILAHLRQICQTRQGTVLGCPEYGVESISELLHSFPEAIDLMMRSLRNTIVAHEPRLKNVQIRHVPTEDLILRFDIIAQVVLSGLKTPIRFETRIDSTRHVSIH